MIAISITNTVTVRKLEYNYMRYYYYIFSQIWSSTIGTLNVLSTKLTSLHFVNALVCRPQKKI